MRKTWYLLALPTWSVTLISISVVIPFWLWGPLVDVIFHTYDQKCKIYIKIYFSSLVLQQIMKVWKLCDEIWHDVWWWGDVTKVSWKTRMQNDLQGSSTSGIKTQYKFTNNEIYKKNKSIFFPSIYQSYSINRHSDCLVHMYETLLWGGVGGVELVSFLLAFWY